MVSEEISQWTVPQGLGSFLAHFCGLETKGLKLRQFQWDLGSKIEIIPKGPRVWNQDDSHGI
jgi:hypothetical protein